MRLFTIACQHGTTVAEVSRQQDGIVCTSTVLILQVWYGIPIRISKVQPHSPQRPLVNHHCAL